MREERTTTMETQQMTKTPMTNMTAMLINEARTKLGLTQIEVSKKLGLKCAQYISDIERGLKPLSPGRFKQLAKILKVPVSYFIECHLEDYRVDIKRKFKM
jgi:transcriptional regulator with XRE-family HTH domain